MTVKEFAEKQNVKENTVYKWIESGYIAGVARTGKDCYYIPNSARKPYTKCRAKTGDAILKSIVTACNQRCGVCSALYKISEAEFQCYISDLLDNKYITKYTEDGVTYYNISELGAEWIKYSNKSRQVSIEINNCLIKS